MDGRPTEEQLRQGQRAVCRDCFEIDIYEHARFERHAGIRNVQPDAHSARRHVDLRKNIFNAAVESAIWVSIDCDSRRGAQFHAANVVLKYLRVNPYARESAIV